MVIRKMKSFRRNVQKKGLHIFKQKVGKTGINRTGSFSWCKAVSYTHLDVYKRQGGGHLRGLLQCDGSSGCCAQPPAQGAGKGRSLAILDREMRLNTGCLVKICNFLPLSKNSKIPVEIAPFSGYNI